MPKCPTCGAETDGFDLDGGTSEAGRTVVISFPTIGAGPKWWNLTQQQVDQWSALYPSLDVLQVCRKAKGWVDADPTRRKTARGMPRFLVDVWLNRDVDRRSGMSSDRRIPEPRQRVGQLPMKTWECPLCGFEWQSAIAGTCRACQGKGRQAS